MAKKITDPWQAESDARVLMEHAELCGNKSRMSAAKKILQKKSSDIDKALGEKSKRPSKPSKSTKSYI